MAHYGYNAIRQRQKRRESRKKFFASSWSWFRKKGWKIFLVVAVLSVAVWQGWFFIRKFNPMGWRTLKTVSITGNHILTWEEILQTAGLETGMPMSEIHADSVRNNLLSLPFLHDAQVDVGFFWKVSINIEETTPLMQVYENGEWNAYSERGQQLPALASARFEYPVATIQKKRDVKALAHFLQKLRQSDALLYKEVSQVSVDEKRHAVEVFFRNVRFKVLFPLDSVSASSFSHYRLLVDGLSTDMNQLKLLDMRFEGFAYAHPSNHEVK